VRVSRAAWRVNSRVRMAVQVQTRRFAWRILDPCDGFV
jgi:hypothetical protein